MANRTTRLPRLLAGSIPVLTAFVLCTGLGGPLAQSSSGSGTPPDSPPPSQGSVCWKEFFENLKMCRDEFCNPLGCREPVFSTCVSGAQLVLKHCLEA